MVGQLENQCLLIFPPNDYRNNQKALAECIPLPGCKFLKIQECFVSRILYDPDLSHNIITPSLGPTHTKKIREDQLSTFGVLSTRKLKPLKIHYT